MKYTDEYNRHLTSDKWRRLAAQARERAGHRCQLCNSENNLEVHHRTYESMGTDREHLDLTVLCLPCHVAFHSRKAKRKNPPVSMSRRKGKPISETKAQQLHAAWFKRFKSKPKRHYVKR